MSKLIAGRYRLGNKLGSGGMGTVYHALDLHTNQPVAIKSLHSDLLQQYPEMVERFRREGEVLRDLNHPNIVKMLDTIEENTSHYLIMEFISGGDLKALLEKGRLPVEDVLRLAIDISDAVTRAHRLNIIHRDLKPANVLLALDGTPRLTDFGVARIASRENITSAHTVIGTLDYLSPEALDGQVIDARTDVWALGVMLFEMLAGQRPFQGSSVSYLIQNILMNPVPDLEALCPEAPVALLDLIYQMLEKDRHTRIASVRHVGAALEDILHRRNTQTPPETRFATPIPDTPARPHHNLPAQTTSFVGREAELSEVAKLLDQPDIRLITIVAPGGMGKTRLAVEIASRYAGVRWQHRTSTPQQLTFKDGVYFVEMAALSDPASIVPAIARAMDYQFQSDASEPKQQVLNFLANKHILLVMDNYEHLLDDNRLLVEILKAAPQVQILATSRQRLNQTGETIFILSGMDFPDWDKPDDALQYAAVKLFMQGAKRAQPGFELTADNLGYVARICKQVDGMPLGILLAASWLGMLSPREIVEEIDASIDFLESTMSDLPQRHRSVRAVFDHSWRLLTDAERQVYMKLSVFRGGFSRQAAQTVTGASLQMLRALVNKSLIQRDVTTGRYSIHELLRQYAGQELDASGAADQSRSAHMEYYALALHEREEDLKGKRQLEALDDIESDFDNVHAAWEYAVQTRAYEIIDRAVRSLHIFCSMRGQSGRGYPLFDLARAYLAPQPGEVAHPVYGKVLTRLNRSEQRENDIEQALAMARERQDVLEEAECLASLAEVLSDEQAYYRAIALLRESLAILREAGDSYAIAHRLANLSTFYMLTGMVKQAERYAEEALMLARQIGDRFTTSSALNVVITFTLVYKANYERAEHLLAESVALAREVGAWERAGWDAVYQSFVLFLMGRMEESRAPLELGQMIGKDINHTWTIEFAQGIQALLIIVTKQDYAAAWEYVQSFSHSAEKHPWGSAWGWLTATAAWGLDDRNSALLHTITALQFMRQMRSPCFIILSLPVSALLLANRGDTYHAVEVLSLALNHPYSPPYFKIDPLITSLQEELQTRVDEETYQIMWERGKSRDLESVIQELLAVFAPGNELESLFPIRILEANAALPEALTERELEIIGLICSGLSNREIAERLVVGTSTVKKHINGLYSKIDVASRAQAILRAQELGLV